MRKINIILIVLLSIFLFFSLVAIIFVIVHLFPLSWSFNLDGFRYFILKFSDFKGLFAGNIVLISVYYWMQQIDNLNSTNSRLEKERLERKQQNSVDESRKFFTHTLNKTSDFISHINNISRGLFGHKWDNLEFSFNSLSKQNFEWIKKIQNIERQHGSKDKVIKQIVYELESVSSIILHGDLDQDLINNLIGEYYINIIEILYPFIAYLRDDKEDVIGDKTIELYKKWSN